MRIGCAIPLSRGAGYAPPHRKYNYGGFVFGGPRLTVALPPFVVAKPPTRYRFTMVGPTSLGGRHPCRLSVCLSPMRGLFDPPALLQIRTKDNLDL